MKDLLLRLLRRDEGCQLEPYRDSRGLWTIGWGHLIDRRRSGELPTWIKGFPILQDEADHLLESDVIEKQGKLSQAWPPFGEQPAIVQVVLVSMAFQLGIGGVLAFQRLLRAIEDKRWADAGVEMRRSAWSRQTPKRAERLARTLESGDPKYLELPA